MERQWCNGIGPMADVTDDHGKIVSYCRCNLFCVCPTAQRLHLHARYKGDIIGAIFSSYECHHQEARINIFLAVIF